MFVCSVHDLKRDPASFLECLHLIRKRGYNTSGNRTSFEWKTAVCVRLSDNPQDGMIIWELAFSCDNRCPPDLSNLHRDRRPGLHINKVDEIITDVNGIEFGVRSRGSHEIQDGG